MGAAHGQHYHDDQTGREVTGKRREGWNNPAVWDSKDRVTQRQDAAMLMPKRREREEEDRMKQNQTEEDGVG